MDPSPPTLRSIAEIWMTFKFILISGSLAVIITLLFERRSKR